MGAKVFQGRYAAATDESVVVFLIGMRINRLRAIRKWWPTFMAMAPMLRELYAHPEKGFLGARTYLSWRTVILVQYWRSFDALDQYARSAQDTHLPAWQQYNKRIRGAKGAVGVFHETYVVPAGQFEAVYVDMPRMGLAEVVEHVPATGSRVTARRRLGGHDEPAVALIEE